MKSKIRIRIHIKVNVKAQNGAMMEGTHNAGVDAQKGAERVCRPMVVGSHHFDEERDPDLAKGRIRIRI
jgi:hypothetical protein